YFVENRSVGPAVIPLGNGNYVIGSRDWNGNRGAVTWANGSTGITGIVSEANSLVGSYPGSDALDSSTHGDQVGIVTPLGSNGNYVVESISWNGQRGAATWGNGSTGVDGAVSDANSLVGSNPGDAVGAIQGYYGFVPDIISLGNDNYLVGSPHWNSQRGALTWVNGSSGLNGSVPDANSLVGSNPGDLIGAVQYPSYGGFVPDVTLLAHGN